MKVCKSCNAQQSDTRVFCIDCGERLGGSISLCEREVIERETQRKLEHMSNSIEQISSRERVIGYISLAGIVAAVLMIAFRRTSENIIHIVLAILYFVFCSLSALAPKVMWALEKHRLRYTIHNADEAEPSDTYVLSRKISIHVFFVAAILILVLSITGIE